MNTDQLKYYEKLGMEREPFTNSVDPGFFYPTPEHMGCIRSLEISLRMNGGVNLILGEPGVGKTMLVAVLLEHFTARNDKFIIRTISKPDFRSEYQFLQKLWETFEIETPCRSTVEYRNALHDYLFRKKIEEGKRVVLIVDEATELKISGIKVLMGLLGYRFDSSRLIHMVIFGGMELLEQIERCGVFEKLIDLRYTINPLDIDEMKEVIFHRLKVAGYRNPAALFDESALNEIWHFSRGNLLRATEMCCHSLTSMTLHDDSIVGPETVKSVARNWRIQL